MQLKILKAETSKGQEKFQLPFDKMCMKTELSIMHANLQMVMNHEVKFLISNSFSF